MLHFGNSLDFLSNANLHFLQIVTRYALLRLRSGDARFLTQLRRITNAKAFKKKTFDQRSNAILLNKTNKLACG